jgi:MFS family permease
MDDLVDRRTTMVACRALSLVATVSAAVALLVDARAALAVLFAAAFLDSLASTFFNMAEYTAVRDVTTEAQRPTAYAWYQAETPVAVMLGRTLGGGLLTVGRAVPFLVDAASNVVCLLALLALPGRLLATRPRRERTSWTAGAVEGFRWMWAVPLIRISTLVTGLTNALFQGVILLVIVVMTEQRQSGWGLGAVLAASGVGGVLGASVAPRLLRRFGPERVYALSLWGWAVALVVVAAVPHPYALAPAWAAVGGIGAVSSVAMTVIRLRSVPEETFGRMLGAVALVTDGLGPLGGVVVGYLLAAAGSRVTGWALAGAMVVTCLIGHRALVAGRRAAVPVP